MERLHQRSIRGPASYAAGGFTYTLDQVEYLGQSSGRMVTAATVSSSPMIAQVVSDSGNIVTIIVRDVRSGGIEPAGTPDLSNLHIALTYSGI